MAITDTTDMADAFSAADRAWMPGPENDETDTTFDDDIDREFDNTLTQHMTRQTSDQDAEYARRRQADEQADRQVKQRLAEHPPRRPDRNPALPAGVDDDDADTEQGETQETESTTNDDDAELMRLIQGNPRLLRLVTDLAKSAGARGAGANAAESQDPPAAATPAAANTGSDTAPVPDLTEIDQHLEAGTAGQYLRDAIGKWADDYRNHVDGLYERRDSVQPIRDAMTQLAYRDAYQQCVRDNPELNTDQELYAEFRGQCARTDAGRPTTFSQAADLAWASISRKRARSKTAEQPDTKPGRRSADTGNMHQRRMAGQVNGSRNRMAVSQTADIHTLDDALRAGGF